MKLVKGENNSDFGLIGRGIEITGDIRFTDRLQVEGKISGKLTSESGTLVIGESGHIEAQVDVGVCVIYGAINGNLVARSKVEIRQTGRVQGDIITPVLIVEEGAVFNGLIRMGQEATARRLEEVLPGVDEDERQSARRAY
ncbi:MAG TPA: polymer-forming cytoskeletal protein [Blastocatellia bacterium]|nr:polymer-forming cytoskeletal protein [Blastocatellia bacterium]